ncbi:MAG: hypothetical protein KDD70_09570 [Bdellovibrionales bacterium]|nr:hypothetical protein [Bdellovibrionales bacterium]
MSYFARSILTVLLLGIVSQVSAEPLVLKGNPQGKPFSFNLSPETPTEVLIYLQNSNKEQQTLDLRVDAPPGTVVSVRSAMESKGSPAPEAVVRKTLPSKIYGVSQSAVKSITVGGSSGSSLSGQGGTSSSSGTGDPSCGCMTESEIQEILSNLIALGFPYTRQQLCEVVAPIPLTSCDISSLSPGNGLPTSSGNTLQFQTFIERDACSKFDHIAIVKLSLNKVDQSYFDSGAEITVTGDFRKFNGNRRASIKPLGEGKYQQPLLLAGPVGGYGFSGPEGEVRLSKWRGSKKRGKSRRVRIADFVYYNGGGGLLWRIPLDRSILRGGRGTFEFRNNSEGYSICAKLSPTRQYFNGYFNN